MQAGYGSHVGQVRETNEDAVLCSERLFVVADGMGGYAAGEIASRLAVETVSGWRFPPETAPFQTVRDEVVRAVHAANQEVYDRGQRDGALKGMGTTLSVALLVGSVAVVAHVGDSRVYAVQENKLLQVTHDHSVVGELVRSGGISEVQARQHPYRNMLTRALGTARHVDVDVERVQLRRGDGLLLCTDGLTGLLADDEIASVIAEHRDPQTAVDVLILMANERGGPDNISAVLAFPGGREG